MIAILTGLLLMLRALPAFLWADDEVDCPLAETEHGMWAPNCRCCDWPTNPTGKVKRSIARQYARADNYVNRGPLTI
jgi:hypothetical protein